VTLNKEKGVGSIKMAKIILKEHGLAKLKTGFLPTMIRESIGIGFYFGVYEIFYPRRECQLSMLYVGWSLCRYWILVLYLSC
jgi:hypothetical protein